MRLFLVSNMYPSDRNIRFGVFVKNVYTILSKEFKVKKIVITKKNNALLKLIGYVVAYIKIVGLIFTVNRKDIVYIHFPLYFSPLVWPLSLTGTSIVLNFHGSDAIYDTPIKRFLFLFLKPVIKRTRIVVPSKYFKEKILNIFDNVLAKDVLIYPSGGVDMQIFYPKEVKRSIFTFGFVSNFILQKGWDVFLCALKKLKTTNELSEFKAIMVGDGPDIESIKKRIESFELNVEIISTVKQAKLSNIYAHFDVLIFPSFRESLGLVGIEAMMCGIPVIASKIDGPMDYIINGHNGFLFEVKNSHSLAQAMLNYYHLSEVEKAVIKEHCIRTAQEYEKQVVKKALIQFLRQH